MFETIIGNNNIKQELIQAINSNKLSHSYIFIGTEGVGKKLFAEEFSKSILCLNEKIYCNKCKSCIEFNTNNNPDFEKIVPDGNSIKIEQIRQIQKKILEAPIVSENKVYIIDDAELMTKEAQNCLLKTLEEPPKYVTIILIGTNEENFLNTIKSRCTIIKFKKISDEEIKKYIKEKYDLDISEKLLKLSAGSIGKAERLKNKEEFYNNIIEIIDKVNKLDLIEFVKQADFIYKSQDEKNEILEIMNEIFFEKSKNEILFLNCIDVVEDTKKRLNANGNYNMCIDNMLFKIWEALH